MDVRLDLHYPRAMTKTAQGHLAMLLFSFLVAGSFALGGMIANLIDPVALTALRFLIASCLLSTLIALSGKFERAHLKAPWRYVLLGASMALYFVMMFIGLKSASPVSTSAVFTLTPIMSALFGWILLRQVTTPWMALALSVGATGALWVIFKADLSAFLAFDIGRGEALFFIGCVGHAIYAPLVPKLNRGEPTVVFTAGMLIAGTVILGIFGAPKILATDWLNLPPLVYLCVAYLSLVTTAFTFFLVQYSAMRLPASKVMAYTYLTPSFVILWEGVLGNGLPMLKVGFGALLTALALVMLLRD